MFIFWKNPQLDNLLSKLTDLYQNIIFIYESKKQKIGCEIEGKQKFKNEFIKTLSPCYCSVCKHKSMIVHIGYLPIFQIHTQSTWYFCEPFLTHLFEALLLIYFSNQYIEGKYPEPRFSLVPALVTQPTLQRQEEQTSTSIKQFILLRTTSFVWWLSLLCSKEHCHKYCKFYLHFYQNQSQTQCSKRSRGTEWLSMSMYFFICLKIYVQINCCSKNIYWCTYFG